jgi:hypothetical protein
MENKQQPKITKFADIKDELIKKINGKITLLGLNEPVTLVDGFINQPISMELSGSFIIGGPTVPMIMIVGNNTGRVHFFALKAVWPDFDK